MAEAASTTDSRAADGATATGADSDQVLPTDGSGLAPARVRPRPDSTGRGAPGDPVIPDTDRAIAASMGVPAGTQTATHAARRHAGSVTREVGGASATVPDRRPGKASRDPVTPDFAATLGVPRGLTGSRRRTMVAAGRVLVVTEDRRDTGAPLRTTAPSATRLHAAEAIPRLGRTRPRARVTRLHGRSPVHVDRGEAQASPADVRGGTRASPGGALAASPAAGALAASPAAGALAVAGVAGPAGVAVDGSRPARAVQRSS